MKPLYETDCGKLFHGHVLDVLRMLPDRSVNCCVTSPPYWGLRDYGLTDQVWGGLRDCAHEWGDSLKIHKGGPPGNAIMLAGGRRVCGEHEKTKDIIAGKFCRNCGAWLGSHGLEPTPGLFVENEISIFSEVRRVLTDDGTCWVNLGDSYISNPKSDFKDPMYRDGRDRIDNPNRKYIAGFKPKDLCGIPWRVAFAMQAAGWYLRQDIVWHKPNTMPESVRDRCTKAHEYIFLLSKSQRYFYDPDAVKEPVTGNSHFRGNGVNPKAALCGDHPGNVDARCRTPGRPEHTGIRKGGLAAKQKVPNGWDTSSGRGGHGSFHKNGREKGTKWRVKQNESFSSAVRGLVDKRNLRSVWTCPTKPFPQAHFATFPPSLIEPCIMAGCPEGGTVLDPFIGSGTTAIVAYRHNRKFIGIDLNRFYLEGIAIPRIAAETAQLKLFP